MLVADLPPAQESRRETSKLTLFEVRHIKSRVSEGGSVVKRGRLAFLWAVIGAVVGQLLGAALSQYVPILNYHISLGLAPTTLDLHFLVMTFGLSLKLTVAGAIGLVLALWLALR